MSTFVPNITITYPKDLSRFYLDFDKLELTNLLVSPVTSYSLIVTKPDLTTVSIDLISYLFPMGTFASVITGSAKLGTDYVNVLTGTATSFLTEVNVNDVIVSNDFSVIGVVEAVISDTSITINSSFKPKTTDSTYYLFNPRVELTLATLGYSTTTLADGTYTFSIEIVSNTLEAITKDFTTYVFANEYNCVESKLMSLALYCSEGCVDMNTLKYTLLLKSLLDSMEVIQSDVAVDTTALSLVKEKIDRYCLLLNNNCTTC